jgi:hypothetical protein
MGFSPLGSRGALFGVDRDGTTSNDADGFSARGGSAAFAEQVCRRSERRHMNRDLLPIIQQ